MRGVEYIELIADDIMPEMFRDFSRYQECVPVLPEGAEPPAEQAAGAPESAGAPGYTVNWDDGDIARVCEKLLLTLSQGGAVIGAFISEEEDGGGQDDEDFTSVVSIDGDDAEPEPYDWYIEDEPPCRAVIGFCAVGPGSAREGLSADAERSELEALCVSEPYRRKGIGKGLFRRAVRAARTFDAGTLFIDSLPDRDSVAFFKAMGCVPIPNGEPGAGRPSSVPMQYELYPRGADGVITLEEYQSMAGRILDTLPSEFFNRLNGGVVVRPEAKIHAQSVPGAPMYVMGEYTRSGMMGRMIYLYYGSFAATCGQMSRSAQKEKLRGIIAHEFRHHMEWLSGTRELEDEDERGLRAYLLRFAKKADGRKKKKDSDK